MVYIPRYLGTELGLLSGGFNGREWLMGGMSVGWHCWLSVGCCLWTPSPFFLSVPHL